MSDLPTDYLEIEKGLNWPEEPKGLGAGQLYKLITGLRAKVRERSLTERLDPAVYEDRLRKLRDLVADLRHALNGRSVDAPDEKKNEQLVWYHRADSQITDVGSKGDQPQIDREWLLQGAATYLVNPWLQSDQIDWILIDFLIFAELSAYRESILTGQALGKINWAYLFSGGDVEKSYWFQTEEGSWHFHFAIRCSHSGSWRSVLLPAGTRDCHSRERLRFLSTAACVTLAPSLQKAKTATKNVAGTPGPAVRALSRGPGWRV